MVADEAEGHAGGTLHLQLRTKHDGDVTHTQARSPGVLQPAEDGLLPGRPALPGLLLRLGFQRAAGREAATLRFGTKFPKLRVLGGIRGLSGLPRVGPRSWGPRGAAPTGPGPGGLLRGNEGGCACGCPASSGPTHKNSDKLTSSV